MGVIKKYYWLLLVFTSIIFTFPLLKRSPWWGMYDWDQHMALSESSRQTILISHQFPLWNPYRCGGMTDIGQPQSRFLWPFFPIILLFGTPAGHTIIFVLHIMIAAVGMFLLARFYKISTTASFFTAMVFAYSGAFTVPFAEGMTNFVNLAWIPWLTLGIAHFCEKKTPAGTLPYIVSTAIGLTVMFFGGWNYMPIMGAFLGILCILNALIRKRWQPIYFGFLTIVLFTGLSAIKLFSSLETIVRYPRPVPIAPNDGYTVGSLLFSLFSRNQNVTGWQLLASRGIVSSFDFGENGMYVGLYSLVFFCLGFLQKKRLIHLLVPLLLFLWIIFGVNITPSLYQALHNFPIFSMMMVSQRYKHFFVMFFALIAGMGFDAFRQLVLKRLKPPLHFLLQIVMLILIFIDLYEVNTSLFTTERTTAPAAIAWNSAFKQTTNPTYTGRSNRTVTYAAGITEYPYIHANYGSIDCYESLPLPQSTAQGYKDSIYKGEVYFRTSGEPVHFSWSSNIITITMEKTLETNDMLIVNQNYDRNWWVIKNKTRIERAVSRQNLLATSMRPTDTNIIFLYLPLSFVYGVIVTTITCFVLGWVSYRYWRSQELIHDAR